MADPCGHCGFKGPLDHKGEVAIKRGTDLTSGGEEYEWGKFASVAVCPVCEDLTLGTYWWIDVLGEPEDYRRIYPTERDNSALPEKVRARLDTALKIKRIDPASYAVAIRRMLETVANIEGATGKDLFHKLDDLAAQERIPERLAEIGHELRTLGKFGAHDDEVEVEDADVPFIEDLAEAILEYLYRAPAKLAAVRAGIEARKSVSDDA
jgi:hypothetical protein